MPERDYCIEKVAEDLDDESMSAEEDIIRFEIPSDFYK